MIIKVCGMCDIKNIRAVEKLAIDWVGFVFDERSPRSAMSMPMNEWCTEMPEGMRRVAVLVDPDAEDLEIAYDCFDVMQIHGDRIKPKKCDKFRTEGTLVIKAFSIAEAADFKATVPYEDYCDYFLFEAKGQASGGNGIKFDWNLLPSYKGKTPFILSGGITPDDADEILSLSHPLLAGIDLNSGFEIAPGLKDVEKISSFVTKIRNAGK